MSIHITTPQELQDIELDLTADYILDNNLDMTGFTWSPVGQFTEFTGTFDGQGFTISNLTSDDTGGVSSYCGIFAQVGAGAVIQNLKMNNVTLIVGHFTLAGAISGFLQDANVTNCEITRLNIVDDGNNVDYYNVGGLIGDISSSAATPVISNCSVSGTITMTGTAFGSIGGLVGFVFTFNAPPNISFDSCTTDVVINLTGDGSGLLSGLGGFIGDASYVDISNCSTTGNISATNFSNYGGVGGLVGNLDFTIDISDCFATGNISCLDSSVVDGDGSFGIGGLIGQCFENDGIIERCYATGNVHFSGGTDYGTAGFVGEFDGGDLAVQNCYCHGNVLSEASVDGFGTGGFAGEVTFPSTSGIKYCYASGTVEGLDQVGGFIGEFSSPTKLISCYAAGIVTSVGSLVGGFIGLFFSENFFTGIIIRNCGWFTGQTARAIGGFVPEWNSSDSYDVGVNPLQYFDGNIYLCIQNNTNKQPDDIANQVYWSLYKEDVLLSLEDMDYGTDEEDNTNFYSKNHAVYQATSFDGEIIQTGTTVDVNTLLLLHLNNNYTDSSGHGKSVTASGSLGFFADPKFGSHCLLFNKLGHVVIPYDSDFVGFYESSGVNLWTVDFWVKVLEDNTQMGLFTNYPTSSVNLIRIERTPQNTYRFYVGVDSVEIQTTLKVEDGWVHIALEKFENDVIKFYVNGDGQAGMFMGVVSVDATPNFYIGTVNPSDDANTGLHGEIDEFRISNIARYENVNFATPQKEYSVSSPNAPIVLPQEDFAAWDISDP